MKLITYMKTAAFPIVASLALAGCSITGTAAQTCKVDNIENLVRQGASVGAFGLSVGANSRNIGNIVQLTCGDKKVEAMILPGYKGVRPEKDGTYKFTMGTIEGMGEYQVIREVQPSK